ncbi:DMT family transporter [Thermomicrobium sp. 4228-Ro]|uniref:DMT family transporter n=1 Tax=Thermomicrobium sp. 4228-Ro TaxID=2993937 RepID=UPI0022488A6A|nr:DMT family transporter [Thermomicrobium sp. 4228-Ro]MCX2727814.1 DMT family transporter [Thermomicrobium sp. 4228-Ro]
MVKGSEGSGWRRWIDGEAFLAVLIWGASFPIVKHGVDSFGPLSFAVLRLIVAIACLVLWLRLRDETLRIARSDWPRLALAGFGAMGIFQIVFLVGMRHTTSTHSALFLNTSPLWALPISWLVERERPRAAGLLGAALGFIGVVLMVGTPDPTGTATLLGDVLTLGAAICWVGVTMIPRPLVARYGAVPITTWLLILSLVVVGLAGASETVRSLATLPGWSAWGALLYTGILAMVGANVFWQRAVQRLGASTTLVYYYLQPGIAVALGAAFLGERVRLVQIVGLFAVFAGVLVAQRAAVREAVPQVAEKVGQRAD